MATLDNTYAAPKAFGFGKIVTSFIAQIAAWNDARATHKVLSQLSDRELNDIGLCRGDIDDLSDHR